MRELDVIIGQYILLKAQKVDCVLATVVHVEGSILPKSWSTNVNR